MNTEELLSTRLRNQHLTMPSHYLTAITDLCGFQAQYISNVFHSLKIRSSNFDISDTSALIKSWTIRGTMHVFAKDDLPLFLYNGRKHNLRPQDTLESDNYISKERKQFFADLIFEKISDGFGEREELKNICYKNGMTDKEAESVFDPWGGTIRALCETGKICHVVQQQKAYIPCPALVPMNEHDAKLELARRYFTNLAPATIKDAAYFFGTSQAEVKALLNELPTQNTVIDGKTYFYIDSDNQDTPELPQCIFLAGFDQIMLGYNKNENPFLPQEYLRFIFNLSGIVMAPVLYNGRVIGKWKISGKKVSVTLFKKISAKEKELLYAYAASLWSDIKNLQIIFC